jgi:hypothetical protein
MTTARSRIERRLLSHFAIIERPPVESRDIVGIYCSGRNFLFWALSRFSVHNLVLKLRGASEVRTPLVRSEEASAIAGTKSLPGII